MEPSVLLRFVAALLGALLLVDALALFSMGLFNLGVLLPLLMGCTLVVLAWKSPRWRAWLARHPHYALWWRMACGLFILWLASVAVFFVHIAHVSTLEPKGMSPQAILILGSGTPHCMASPALASRLDKGVDLAAKWPQALLVVSGGQSWGRTCTEAQVMADYLRAKGMSAARIVQEKHSTSTYENLHFSRPVLQEQGVTLQDTIIIVTSDYHTLRTTRIAARAGYLKARLTGVPTPLYLRYNAWLREYFAFISGWLLGEY